MGIKPNFDRIGTKILGANILVLLFLILIVIGAGINFYRTRVSLANTSQVYVPQITLANSIKESVLQQHLAVQTYINHPSVEVKGEYRDRERQFEDSLRQIRELATDKDKELIDQVKQEHDNFSMIANNVFTYSDKNRTQLVKTLLDNYSVSVARVIASSNQLAKLYEAELNASVYNTEQNLRFALGVMLTLTLFSLGGALLLTFLLTRKITAPMINMINVSHDIAQGDLRQRVSLQDNGELGLMASSFNSMVENLSSLIEEVVAASKYIVKVSQDFHTYANDSALASNTADSVLKAVVDSSAHQSRNLISISRSVENVATSIHQIDVTIQKVNQHNSQTTHLAEEGTNSVEHGFHQMQIIKETMDFLSGIVNELSTDLEQISHIIGLMENFAEQTNLLALNAAIEAARVGEEGKGFAVVANEVRKLADESSKSLEQIRLVIGKLEQKSAETVRTMEEGKNVVESGTLAMQKVSKALGQILGFINSSVTQFEGLVSASSDISKHSKIIAKDIKDLEVVSYENAAHSQTLGQVINRQTRAVMEAAASLGEIAVTLEQSAGKFALAENKRGAKQ